MRALILVFLVALSAATVSTRSIHQHNVVRRFLGLPSISDITGRIKEKLTETLDKVQDKILETILAGGDIAAGVLETVLKGQETLLPYADKLRTILADIRSVAEATENEWAKQRERLLAHIKEIFDMILAEEEVKALMQKVQEMIDNARETAKSSKEKAQDILKNLRVLVWGGIMSAGSSMDLLLGLVGKRSIDSYEMNHHMEVKRFLGFPSIANITGRIKEKLTETLGNVQDKILDAILVARGEIAYFVIEKFLRVRPYIDKLKIIFDEIKRVAESTENDWATERERLLAHVKEFFGMIMAEEEVQAFTQKVQEMIDNARETAKSSKEKAQHILNNLGDLVWGGIMSAGGSIDALLKSVDERSIDSYEMNHHMVVKRFLGLPSISDIAGRIKDKLKETLDKVQAKILETILAGGEIAAGVLETVLQGEKKLLPYADKVRTVLAEIKGVAEATEAKWAEQRERLLAHIKEIFDMIWAEEEVQSLMQKVQEMIDNARETAKSSKEKAQDILKNLRVLVWGGIMSAGSSMDLLLGLVGKRSIDSYEINYEHMEEKRFLGLPSISDIAGRIKDKLKEMLDKAQAQILETILAGGEIAAGVLETVLQGEKKLLPYADKVRTVLAEIKGVAEATEAKWAEQRERLLEHIKEIFDMILAEEEVQALMQKVQEMIDNARETAKSSKEKAQDILKNLRVLVWGGMMSAGSSADLIFNLIGKRDLQYYDIDEQMVPVMKRFLGLPSISDIYGKVKDRIIASILAGGEIAYDLLERILQNEKIKPYAEKLRTILYEIKEVNSAKEHEWGKLRQRLLDHVKELFEMFMAEDKVQAVIAKVAAAIDRAREVGQSSADTAKAILNKVSTYIWAGVLAIGAPIDLVVGGIAGKIFETILG